MTRSPDPLKQAAHRFQTVTVEHSTFATIMPLPQSDAEGETNRRAKKPAPLTLLPGSLYHVLERINRYRLIGHGPFMGKASILMMELKRASDVLDERRKMIVDRHTEMDGDRPRAITRTIPATETEPAREEVVPGLIQLEDLPGLVEELTDLMAGVSEFRILKFTMEEWLQAEIEGDAKEALRPFVEWEDA